MENKLIKVEVDKFVAKVLLDNPDKKNALDDSLIKELIFVLDELDRNSSVRVVLLGSANETFCSGGDIKAMMQKTDMFKGKSIDLRKQYHEGIQEISHSKLQSCSYEDPHSLVQLRVLLSCLI